MFKYTCDVRVDVNITFTILFPNVPYPHRTSSVCSQMYNAKFVFGNESDK